jgi:hypothetical protein
MLPDTQSLQDTSSGYTTAKYTGWS